jgi:hypothetical protein
VKEKPNLHASGEGRALDDGRKWIVGSFLTRIMILLVQKWSLERILHRVLAAAAAAAAAAVASCVAGRCAQW